MNKSTYDVLEDYVLKDLVDIVRYYEFWMVMGEDEKTYYHDELITFFKNKRNYNNKYRSISYNEMKFKITRPISLCEHLNRSVRCYEYILKCQIIGIVEDNSHFIMINCSLEDGYIILVKYFDNVIMPEEPIDREMFYQLLEKK